MFTISLDETEPVNTTWRQNPGAILLFAILNGVPIASTEANCVEEVETWCKDLISEYCVDEPSERGIDIYIRQLGGEAIHASFLPEQLFRGRYQSPITACEETARVLSWSILSRLGCSR